jgi:two-component system response regulator RegX3
MPEQVTVLVVEDEPSYVDALTVGLKREGFWVAVAYDGAAALEKFATIRPDVVLLDIMLPKVSGIDVCRTIRAGGSRTPVIMVTAKSSEIDTVLGLEVGADDYVSKPYRLSELVARIRAVLRRTPPSGPALAEGEVLEVKDLRLDPERHEVFVRNQVVSLRLKEFKLLEVLMTNAGRVVTRETLIDRVWGPQFVGDTKTLDVHVKRLRARVEDEPSDPQRTTTVRGIGYKFEKAKPGR